MRPRVPASGDRPAPPDPGAAPLHRDARGPASSRVARRPHGRHAARRDGALRGARHQAGLRGPGAGRPGPVALRAQALHHPEALREGHRRGRRARADVRLPAEPFVQHADLQGHAQRRPDRVHVPGRDRSRRRVRARARAPAVQHQHLPLLAARASLPVRRAQRRDQHPPGQHQLDARPRGAVPLRRVRRRAVEGPARHARRAVGLGHLRQRPRVPGHERALPAPRDPDDDPGAVAEARVDEPGAPRLLRVPLGPDGALGRPGVDRLHRRDRDRGDPRSKRAPALPLLRDEGRSGRHGVRGGCAGHPARERADQGAAPSGADLPGRHGARPDRRRRGDQGPARCRAPLRRLAPRQSRPARRSAQAQGAPRRSRHGPPAADRVRVHARGPPDPPGADGAEGRGGARLHGHRHGAGRPVEPAAAPLRLLQAALRPGHEPAPGPDPGGARDVDGVHHRTGGESPRAPAGVLPPDRDPGPGALERRGGPAPPPAAPVVQVGDASDALPGRRGRRGARAGARGAPGRGEPGDRRRAQRAHPVRPGDLPRPGGDPEPPRDGRGPPPPRAARRAHARGLRPRDGRRARGAPHVPAHRVRRRRGESLGRLRDSGRHDPPGPPAGHRPPGGRQELHQGAQQGDPQGHGQDGDLGPAELLRSPDLRGHRPRQGGRRPLLHRHALARQRYRPRRHR